MNHAIRLHPAHTIEQLHQYLAVPAASLPLVSYHPDSLYSENGFLGKDGFFFFFKQKTAYEMIWCWSSDVCSSDLRARFYARPKSYASEGCLTQAGCQKIFKDKASAGHTARPGWAKTLEM